MSHHRATIITPDTWKEPWKFLWRNKRKHVKKAVVKCDICHPTGKTSKRTRQFRDRKLHDPRRDYHDARYEAYTDLVEDREWAAFNAAYEEDFKIIDEYYDDLYAPWHTGSYCKYHPTIWLENEDSLCAHCEAEEQAFNDYLWERGKYDI